jgi:hypothetical protein
MTDLIGKKLKLSLWGGGGITTPFLTLEPDGDEWSGSRLCSFAARDKSPGTH